MIDTHIQHQYAPTVTLDASGLACPLPLLKLKVALRELAKGQSVYLTTTDANSQTDIHYFCQHSCHRVEHLAQTDTGFHFVIVK